LETVRTNQLVPAEIHDQEDPINHHIKDWFPLVPPLAGFVRDVSGNWNLGAQHGLDLTAPEPLRQKPPGWSLRPMPMPLPMQLDLAVHIESPSVTIEHNRGNEHLAVYNGCNEVSLHHI
jgi:hypothetical protein